MDKEKRYYRSELRAAAGEDKRGVEGYAALFNVESADLGFRERILPGAFDGVIEESDVMCPLDHNMSRGILARSNRGKGSLTLTIDEKGLKYNFTAPNTALGDEVIEGISRGDIAGSSFCFAVEKETWEDLGNGEYLRSIEKIKRLYDVSPVYNPAYPDTTVALRSLEEARKKCGHETPIDMGAYYREAEQQY